jgi:hypothetical protein
MMLCSVASHHQSQGLNKQYAFIYIIRREKEGKIGTTGRIIVREGRYIDVVTI